MAKFKKWVKNVIDSVVDPDREARLRELVQFIEHGIQTQQQSFQLSPAVANRGFDARDVRLAADRVYREILTRGWRDGKLSARQQEVATWVARSLELPADEAHQINAQFARDSFAKSLAEALEDGILEPSEEQWLQEIAASVGSNMREFARMFFRSEGEAFLRGIFLACVDDNQLSQHEWEYLLTVTEKFGLTKQEMLLAVQSQACSFVEHVLADAKSDGRLSVGEESTLYWLIGNLELPVHFRSYVAGEVGKLRSLTEIADGHLPSIVVPAGVAVKSGEIVHYFGPSTWQQVRMLKSGPRTDNHHGTIMLTDNRLVFASPTKSQTLTYRRIVSHRGCDNWIEALVEGRPVSTFFLSSPSPIPYAIFSTAISMSNQTVVARRSHARSRHIPREVRQRVWQKYGGRCAECRAQDYLEFDHIIPVAKGGSNADANVQLLCRRCNLKKSDHI